MSRGIQAMAYLDDYPHLYALQKKYPLCPSPIEELKEAMRLDSYPLEQVENASYDKKVAQRKPTPRATTCPVTPDRGLALFKTLGIKDSAP